MILDICQMLQPIITTVVIFLTNKFLVTVADIPTILSRKVIIWYLLLIYFHYLELILN